MLGDKVIEMRKNLHQMSILENVEKDGIAKEWTCCRVQCCQFVCYNAFWMPCQGNVRSSCVQVCTSDFFSEPSYYKTACSAQHVLRLSSLEVRQTVTLCNPLHTPLMQP